MTMLVYVAGKYSDVSREAIKRNIAKAEEIGQALLVKGYLPIIPHKITSFWDTKGLTKGWEHRAWIDRWCLPLLNRCDAVFMVAGWETSPGATIEYHHATAKGKPIFFSMEALCSS